jgi:hypothetical protein
VYQTLVYFHFTPSVRIFYEILTEPFTMPILPFTPKLHRFGFQNYNTHPVHNDVVLAINFFFKRKILKKCKKSGGAGGGGRTTPMLVRPTFGGGRTPFFHSRFGGGGGGPPLKKVAEPPPWGWFDPQTGRGGGSSHPLAKNGVVWSHPRFSSSSFF